MQAPRTRGPSTPAPVCHRNRSRPGRGQVQTASGLLTALPARRPLKRKREGETARVKKESALLGRVAGANHRGRRASCGPPRLSGSRAPLRHPGTPPPPPTPAHHARSPRTGLQTCGEQALPLHTVTPAPPRDPRRARARAAEFLRPSPREGARGWGEERRQYLAWM